MLSVFYYSVFAWFKKPIIDKTHTFTYHKTSQIKTIVILCAGLIVLEGLLIHFLLQMWNEIIAWIFTILNVYGLLYIVGLYNSVKFLPHMIEEKYLTIRLGYQSSIHVDIHNIERIQTAKESSVTDKVPKDTYYSLLKIDSPQYEISLKEPTLMKTSYGKKVYINSIVFRADESREFVDAIEHVRTSPSTNE